MMLKMSLKPKAEDTNAIGFSFTKLNILFTLILSAFLTSVSLGIIFYNKNVEGDIPEVLAGYTTGTPLKFHKALVRDSTLKQSPIPEPLRTTLLDTATEMDLIYPIRADYRKDDGTKAYNQEVYDIMRSANPDIVLIEYANVTNWAGNVFYLEEVPEEWFLHDPVTSRRKEDRLLQVWVAINPDIDGYNEWVFDKGNPEFIDFFTNKVVDALAYNMDGLWFDNSDVPRYIKYFKRWSDGQHIIPTNPRTGKKYTLAEQREELITLAQTVRSTVEEAFPGGKFADGRTIYMFPNISHEIISEEWPLVDAYRGVCGEGGSWFTHKDIDQYSMALWKSQVDSVAETMKRGYPFIYIGKPYEGSTPWPGRSRLMFAYASTLLAAGAQGDDFYFRYNYGSHFDWPGFNVDIGYARGDYFIWPGSTNIYARWFDNALILVNPSNVPETVDPGVTYSAFMDSSDAYGTGNMNWQGLGTSTNSQIEIRGYEAQILVTNDVPPGEQCTGQCLPNPCSDYINCYNSSGGCANGNCCTGTCLDAPPIPQCTEQCLPNACNTYNDCTQAVGDCVSGICCSGICTIEPIEVGGLIGHWEFDEGTGTVAYDSSSRNNTGYLHKSPLWTLGKFGQSLSFNGLDEYVRVSNKDDFNIEENLTLMGWVNPNGTSKRWNPTVIGKPGAYRLTIGRNQIPEIAIKSPGADQANIWGYINCSAGYTDRLAEGKWYHVAGTYNIQNKLLELYINGNLVCSKAITGNDGKISLTKTSLDIGLWTHNASYLNATLDDIKIFNQALTKAEIKNEMGAVVSDTPPIDLLQSLNSDFTYGSNSWSKDTYDGPSGYTGAFSWNKNAGPDGTNDGAVNITNTQNANSRYMSSDQVLNGKLTPGAKYKFSYWVRNENVSGNNYSYATVYFYDNTQPKATKWIIPEQNCSRHYGVSEWQKVECIVTAPSGGNSARIDLHLKGIGNVWFDKISLTPD